MLQVDLSFNRPGIPTRALKLCHLVETRPP